MKATIYNLIRRTPLNRIYKYYKYLKIGNMDEKKFIDDNLIPEDLKIMLEYYIHSLSYNEDSRYWHYLNAKNIQQLLDYGYENFNRTISRNYHLWFENESSVVYQDLKKKTKDVTLLLSDEELNRKHILFTDKESRLYNNFVYLLLKYVKKLGLEDNLNYLEAPSEGNPAVIHHGSKKICQNVLHSLIEINSINKGTNLKTISSILEIGAGSGRTAHAILKLFPHIKYIIVDIPPALYISQTYLSGLFPNKKILKFNPDLIFDEFRNCYTSYDLIFLMPDQFELLYKNEKKIDLFLAIDCLHEMLGTRIEKYFNCADAISKNFYFKIWNEAHVPFDDVYYSPLDYPIKSTWKKIFAGQCDFPITYYEAYYKIE